MYRWMFMYTKEMEKDFSELLTEWDLTDYISSFKSHGYTDIRDWKQVKLTDLTNKLKMKIGHAKKFVRLSQAYFTKDEFLN